MKKILIGLVALLLVVVGGAYTWYHISYGGENYYMQVTQDGEKVKSKDDSGKSYTYYEYKTVAYQKAGKSKHLDFTATHNLRHQAYLEITYNNRKGVTSWEEVKKADVPEKALAKITPQNP